MFYLLNFVWNANPVFLDLGPIKIHYYGLLFASGIFIGYLFWRQQMMKHLGYSEEIAEDFVMWGFFAILIGARLGHFIFYDPMVFINDPIEIFKIMNGGLASHGATAGLILALYRHHRRYNIPFLDVLDSLTISAGVCAVTIRLGNFMNSEIVGRVTDVPWAIEFPRHAQRYGIDKIAQPRHPSQLYEAGMGLIILITLLSINRYFKNKKRPRGLLISTFFIMYFSGRFIVEYFKEYQTELTWLTMGQYLSIPFVIAGLLILFSVITNPKYPEPPKTKKDEESKDEESKKQDIKKKKNKHKNDKRSQKGNKKSKKNKKD